MTAEGSGRTGSKPAWRRAYLDHAATTPMRPEAVEAMVPLLGDGLDGGVLGNASGAHSESRRARRVLEDARDQIAGLLGVDPGEVVFTAGGTEADNLAVGGVVARASDGSASHGPIVCSAVEHHAVLNPCRAAARLGFELREVAVDRYGRLDLDSLAASCTPDVSLVSLMAVNNEIGTVQPIAEAAAIVSGLAPRAVLHTDAVQAVPWLEPGPWSAAVDLMAASAHKFGGPPGAGCLVVRDGTFLEPIIRGGGQERERRSGTANLAGAVGMAAALAATSADRAGLASRVAALRDRLVDGLRASVPGCEETGRREETVPGHGHLRFAGVEAEALVVLLDEGGVAASAGAACSSGAVEVSHVLTAMGFSEAEAASGVRFSLGWNTTDSDVELALAVAPSAVDRLRGEGAVAAQCLGA